MRSGVYFDEIHKKTQITLYDIVTNMHNNSRLSDILGALIQCVHDHLFVIFFFLHITRCSFLQVLFNFRLNEFTQLKTLCVMMNVISEWMKKHSQEKSQWRKRNACTHLVHIIWENSIRVHKMCTSVTLSSPGYARVKM